MISQNKDFFKISLSGFIFFLLFIGSVNFSMRTSEAIETNLIDFSVLHRIVVFFILFSFVFYKLPRLLKTIKRNNLLRIFLYFCIYRIASSSWSVFPLWSFYRSVEFTIVFLFFVYILSTLDKSNFGLEKLKSHIRRLCFFYVLLMLTVILGAIVWPDLALSRGNNILPQIKGVIPRWNSNGIGQASAILVGISIVSIFYLKDKFSFLLLSLSLPMLLLAQTRSALAPLLIFILWFVTKHFSYLTNILTYMISFLIFLFLFITSDIFIIVFDYLLRGQTSEQLLSFSSRFIVWEATLQNVEYNMFRLFFGLGAFAGGRLIAQRNFESLSEGAPITTLDNTWLELWVDEGLFGVFFGLYIIFLAFLKIKHTPVGFFKAIGYCLFIIIIFRSFFVSSTFLHTNFFFMILIIIAVQLDNLRNLKNERIKL